MGFSSGNDTIIAFDKMFQIQTKLQICLILEENNTIKVGRVMYDLITPYSQTAGIKILTHAVLQPNTAYKGLLDFDHESSIAESRNEKYVLKP